MPAQHLEPKPTLRRLREALGKPQAHIKRLGFAKEARAALARLDLALVRRDVRVVGGWEVKVFRLRCAVQARFLSGRDPSAVLLKLEPRPP